MKYSTEQQKNTFIQTLQADVRPSSQPLFVLDLDGNAAIGYNPQAGTQPVAQDAQRNFPANADMPALEKQGKAVADIFAQKPLDSRLLPSLVDQLNAADAKGEPYRLAILTSRSEAHALMLLRDSGVNHPQNVTLIADSGAIMRISGQRTAVCTPSANEQAVLSGLENMHSQFQAVADAVLNAHGLDVGAEHPGLEIEPKGIATNLHFRALLTHYGLADDSSVAQDMADALQNKLSEYIAVSPVAESFKLLHGPATLEMKLADIHKGHGLKALAQAAFDADKKPSAIIFAGDDVCNHDKHGTVTPGTDYFAFAALNEIEENARIPCHGIHTLHNENASLAVAPPNARKAIAPMAAPYDTPIAASVVVANPLELSTLVDAALTLCQQRSQEIDEHASSFRCRGSAEKFR